MRRIWAIIFNCFLVALPTLAWAADPGEKTADFAAKQVKVAGLNAVNYFFASTYNSSKMVFAIVVTVIMGLIGAIIAFVTDRILKVIGMDVSKIEHHE
jgi:multidrug efflux pump subunit AcrB